MRIDGDKSAKVWARRLEGLVKAAEADGVAFIAYEGKEPTIEDVVLVYKDGRSVLVGLKVWSEE